MRHWFDNIPPIEDFIARRTWRYIGKAYRASEDTLPKKFLNAWIHAPKKPGRPQVTCRENFVNSLRRILPNEVDEEGGFKGWTKYAKNEQIWDGIVEKFFKELKPSDDGSPKKSEKKSILRKILLVP